MLLLIFTTVQTVVCIKVICLLVVVFYDIAFLSFIAVQSIIVCLKLCGLDKYKAYLESNEKKTKVNQ